jgi:hypothetical protein
MTDRGRSPVAGDANGAASAPGALVRECAAGYRAECPRCGWTSRAAGDVAAAGMLARLHRRTCDDDRHREASLERSR